MIQIDKDTIGYEISKFMKNSNWFRDLTADILYIKKVTQKGKK